MNFDWLSNHIGWIILAIFAWLFLRSYIKLVEGMRDDITDIKSILEDNFVKPDITDHDYLG